MRNVLIVIFVLLLNNINAQDKEFVKSYENGIRGVGFNGSGYNFCIENNEYVFKIRMTRGKKMDIQIPFSDRTKLINLLKKTVRLMEKGVKENLNINKMVGDYDVKRHKMRLEFEGRGKGKNYQATVCINAYDKKNKVVYFTMNKHHIHKFLHYISDVNYNKYLKEKK